MKTTIGGDRLGSGNKQKVDLKNYERSTHDMSYVWRSSMASGTLVPFLCEVGLPGDSFDIELNSEILTLPTIGPLFGRYKAQYDVFTCPVRLYNAKLHMNALGIGMDMAQIKLPYIAMEASALPEHTTGDNSQINSSSIFSYLGIRGLGRRKEGEVSSVIERNFNGLSYLMIWDIYKNYYANKQEEIGYVIHNTISDGLAIVGADFETPTVTSSLNIMNEYQTVTVFIESFITITFSNYNEAYGELKVEEIMIEFNSIQTPILDIFEEYTSETNMNSGTLAIQYFFTKPRPEYQLTEDIRLDNIPIQIIGTEFSGEDSKPTLVQFDLANIDQMRTDILQASGSSAFRINKNSIEPYGLSLKQGTGANDYSKRTGQEGLPIKTYQSDLFNNWISTEWIDGDNGVNAITAIDTSSGEFTVDTLNLSTKVYNMLNRIAISGGSYDDWLDAVYTHERTKSIESPIYAGGMIKWLGFQEVVSNAASENAPLGTLAGRGVLTEGKKGGSIKIKIQEPSYIIALVSLTPIIDYSQGNKWDVNLETMDDFHKPALDEIGFQDLITDQMAWFDTEIDDEGVVKYKSAGKQPAWINYMTNVNQVRGNFAVEEQEMFMVLNRRYEQGEEGIMDLTTYIDPSKFNHIFADTRLDAQNFWVQIGINITARRKMSAKLMPNL